jgi:dGTP triphosphohydrolase
MNNEMSKNLDVFLALLGGIDNIKDHIANLDKETHIVLASDQVSSFLGNAECFRILKLVETLNANICGLNASVLNAAEQVANWDGQVKKTETELEKVLSEDEVILKKMNEMADQQMKQQGNGKNSKDTGEENKAISNMLKYFKERFDEKE